jgi:hypothetical protein
VAYSPLPKAVSIKFSPNSPNMETCAFNSGGLTVESVNPIVLLRKKTVESFPELMNPFTTR